MHRGTLGERCEAGGRGQLGDALRSGRPVLPEQATEEIQVLSDREAGVEIATETLGHVGDALDHGVALAALPQIVPEHLDPTGLDLPHPGDNPEQRRLAHPVGPDQAGQTSGGELERHTIEGVQTPVDVAQPAQSDDGAGGVLGHSDDLGGGSLGSRCSGQGASGLSCTEATPGSPVFTSVS